MARRTNPQVKPQAKPAAGNREAAGLTKPEARLPLIPADEAFSFLRETRGVSTWTARDMADSLKISLPDAKHVIAVLEMQGYVNQFKPDEFMTTFAGESISSSKPPRYTRERIEEALEALRQRIAETNRDSGAPFRVTHAVAFGDFLGDRTRFQTVEIGIQLEPRRPSAISIVKRAATRQQFLRQLREKVPIIQLRPYQDWMGARTHRNLLG
jgi:hypothetical protein